MTEFALIILGGLKFGSIYALAALGLVVIHKATRTVNFAHGAFVLLGAFGAFYIQVDKGWPAWVAYLLVPIAVGIFSSTIEVVILRPLRRADLFTVVIATVFLGVVISEGFRLTYKAEILAVPSTFAGAPFFIGPVILTQDALWTICGAIVVSAACIAIFRYAKAARGMRAMAANYRGAQLCGFSVDRTYALAWFFGGAIAGIAGVFAAPAKGVSPELSIIVIASAFVAAVIGGFDSLKGAIYGGLLLGLIETLAAAYGSSALKSAISFLVLFAVMLFRPEGLFPEAKKRHV
ncbi:MAG: branched-chain amino acid ABC transporter permease [Pseudomonadota bacterium]